MKAFRLMVLAWVIVIGARGAANVQRIADLNPGVVGSFPSNITVFANSLYFGAYTLATGRELWKYDGTNVTLVMDINETQDDIGSGVKEGNDSLPSWLTPLNDWLYFSAYDPRRGAELWRHNATTTQRVTDISPDINDTIKFMPNSAWPSELVVLNDELYFSANSGTEFRQDYEMWKYNGTTTSLVANIRADIGANHSSYPNNLKAWNGSILFMADDGVNGYELWQANSAGATLLTNINPGGPESSSYPKKFTPFQNELFFVAVRDDVGYEIWKTDGTNVTLAADIFTGAESSYPDYLTEFNGALYFRASDAATGSELWKYENGAASLAFDVNPFGDSFPKNLIVFGSKIVFAADDGINGWELWTYDGAQASLVTNLNAIGSSYPEVFTVLDGALYFTATTPETGYELWKFDGTNVTLAADIHAGPGDSFPQFLTIFNNSLFFRAAEDGATNWELWSYTPDAPPLPEVTVAFQSIERVGEGVKLQWTTAGGSTNIVQAASEVTGPFTDLSPEIIAPGAGESIIEFTDNSPPATRFYRIKRL